MSEKIIRLRRNKILLQKNMASPKKAVNKVKPKVIRQVRRRAQRKMGASSKKRSSKPINTGPKGGTSMIPTTDARVATSKNFQIALNNQLKTITIDKSFSVDNLVWLINGYISKALERGFAAGASAPEVPWFAQIFAVNLLANYAQSQVVPVTQLPYWMLQLGHALSPKTVPFGQGSVSYKFSITGTLPYAPSSPTFAIGAFVYHSKYTLAGQGGGSVNGFPVADSVIPSGYTDQAGASAFQELAQFMANNELVNKRQAQMVTSSMSTDFSSDVSAFAVFTQAEGTGASGQGGGIYGQLQLEVPIRHPLIALVSCADDTFFTRLPTRNFNWATTVAGDPMLLGSMMSTTLSSSQLSAKRNFRIKNVDFLLFGDLIAQFVQQLVQSYINDFEKTDVVGNAPGSALKALCPLTLQEVLLLLRNLMMGAFKESQAGVQGIMPFAPASGTDNEFTPYVASATQCSIDTLDMLLPTPMVENIRALVARMIKFPGSPWDVIWYLPCLGQYFQDVLSSSDYQVTYFDTTLVPPAPATISVFKTGVIFEKTEYDLKGNMTKTKMVEDPINLIDGSMGSSLVFINDPNQLKNLITLWNVWLNTSGVGSYSAPLINFGTEKGINVLCSIAMTRTWSPSGSLRAARKGKASEQEYIERRKSLDRKTKIVDLRFQGPAKRNLTATPFATRFAIVDTSQGEILSAPYEQVQGTWILPINDDELIVEGQSTLLQRYQFMMEEPHAKTRSSGETGVTFAALNSVYASKMVRGKLSQVDDWTSFFKEMEKLGRGGILSGLVAGFVGNAFPEFGGIAKTIAGILPI